MAKMMAGQDSSMDSDQTNGMQDNDTQNAPLSKTRSQVHLGMIFFASMLFLDNAINVYTYFAMFNLYQVELLPFVLLVRVVQLIGSLVFLKITWQ
jgi:hypothetical protein